MSHSNYSHTNLVKHAHNTHLDSLVLEWFVRIVHVLKRDPVKLAFVDVGDAVVLAPLRTAARRLQVVLEPVRGKPVKNNAYLVPENIAVIIKHLQDQDHR